MKGGIRSPVLLLGALPFLILVLALPFVNRLYPFVFGLPFIVFWILMGTVLTPLFLFAADRWVGRRKGPGNGDRR